MRLSAVVDGVFFVGYRWRLYSTSQQYSGEWSVHRCHMIRNEGLSSHPSLFRDVFLVRSIYFDLILSRGTYFLATRARWSTSVQRVRSFFRFFFWCILSIFLIYLGFSGVDLAYGNCNYTPVLFLDNI